jgi:hypothetical protein
MDVVLDSDTSTTRARLELAAPGGTKFVGIGLVHGGPRGSHLPAVAEELALARALSDLTEELLEAVATDIESESIEPLRLPAALRLRIASS